LFVVDHSQATAARQRARPPLAASSPRDRRAEGSGPAGGGAKRRLSVSLRVGRVTSDRPGWFSGWRRADS